MDGFFTQNGGQRSLEGIGSNATTKVAGLTRKPLAASLKGRHHRHPLASPSAGRPGEAKTGVASGRGALWRPTTDKTLLLTFPVLDSYP